MVDTSSVIEGNVKFRDGKKWKSRWAIMRKLSPVADCVHLQLYRKQTKTDKQQPSQLKQIFALQNFLGLETDFPLDKEHYTISILCQNLIVNLAFDHQSAQQQWHDAITTQLGHRPHFNVFIVSVPTTKTTSTTTPPPASLNSSRIPLGPAHLHFQEQGFCLTSGVPPRNHGEWHVAHLRRYGLLEGGRFCFEGGSRGGGGKGLHVLLSSQGAEILDLVKTIADTGQCSLYKRKKTPHESGTFRAIAAEMNGSGGGGGGGSSSGGGSGGGLSIEARSLDSDSTGGADSDCCCGSGGGGSASGCGGSCGAHLLHERWSLPTLDRLSRRLKSTESFCWTEYGGDGGGGGGGTKNEGCTSISSNGSIHENGGNSGIGNYDVPRNVIAKYENYDTPRRLDDAHQNHATLNMSECGEGGGGTLDSDCIVVKSCGCVVRVVSGEKTHKSHHPRTSFYQSLMSYKLSTTASKHQQRRPGAVCRSSPKMANNYENMAFTQSLNLYENVQTFCEEVEKVHDGNSLPIITTQEEMTKKDEKFKRFYSQDDIICNDKNMKSLVCRPSATTQQFFNSFNELRRSVSVPIGGAAAERGGGGCFSSGNVTIKALLMLPKNTVQSDEFMGTRYSSVAMAAANRTANTTTSDGSDFFDTSSLSSTQSSGEMMTMAPVAGSTTICHCPVGVGGGSGGSTNDYHKCSQQRLIASLREE